MDAPTGSGDEAIAAARYRLDVARLLRVVAERRPHFADRRLEHRVGDEPMAPDGVEQLVLRHQLAGLARQCAEHGERLRRERYGFAGARRAVRRLRRARSGRSAAARQADQGFIAELAIACSIERKDPATPGLSQEEEGEETEKSRDCRGEVVNHDASSLGACRAAAPLRRGTPLLCAACTTLAHRISRLRLWYRAARDFASASRTHSSSSSGANGLLR